MKMNKRPATAPVFTHEGAKASRIGPVEQLRRSVMACMLWEDSFYEDGQGIADRIYDLVGKVSAFDAHVTAVDARNKQHLRHAPLMIAIGMLKNHSGKLVGDTIADIINRPDEAGELIAMYRSANPGKMIPRQMKLGISRALRRFDEYQLAKWDSRKSQYSLANVIHLCHPRAGEDREFAQRLAKVANKSKIPSDVAERYGFDFAPGLETPNTWETRLSGGEDKKSVFTDLLSTGKLGALALLRNLRNMIEAGVSTQAISLGVANMNTERVLPFRFLAAARYAPQFKAELQMAMFKCLAGLEALPGRTVLLVDISGSMREQLSRKSDMERTDAAIGLAVLLREICDSLIVVAFHTQGFVIDPGLRGFELHDAIDQIPSGGTDIGGIVRAVHNGPEYDRIVIVTDEQSMSSIPAPKGLGYIVNVAPEKNGIGYGEWTHINGWSEKVVQYIAEAESKTRQAAAV